MVVRACLRRPEGVVAPLAPAEVAVLLYPARASGGSSGDRRGGGAVAEGREAAVRLHELGPAAVEPPAQGRPATSWHRMSCDAAALQRAVLAQPEAARRAVVTAALAAVERKLGAAVDYGSVRLSVQVRPFGGGRDLRWRRMGPRCSGPCLTSVGLPKAHLRGFARPSQQLRSVSDAAVPLCRWWMPKAAALGRTTRRSAARLFAAKFPTRLARGSCRGARLSASQLARQLGRATAPSAAARLLAPQHARRPSPPALQQRPGAPPSRR
jgi:hypothetical protein